MSGLAARMPGYRALRFARMAGSSIATPGAAGWVTDFLNAAYYVRPHDERSVDDLRLAYTIVTSRWHELGSRLRGGDVREFHGAFGSERFDRGPSARGFLSREQLVSGGAALLGPWFPRAVHDRALRGWGIAFIDARARAAYEPELRLRSAALGPLTPPRGRGESQHWKIYPSVALPSAEAGIQVLSDPSRWPEFASALGRFTAMRSGGLEGQTFEIEVVAHPTPRTPVFTRAYVTATRLLDDPDAIAALLREAGDALDEPALPTGATARLLVELTTHEGHFLGPGVSRLFVFERDGEAFVRDLGSWEPLAWHLQPGFRLAGRAAQHAFWGGSDPSRSMLHQLAEAAQAV